jgi:hypothetical protein
MVKILTVDQASAYIEVGGKLIRVDQVGAYIEQSATLTRVDQVGAYIETLEPFSADPYGPKIQVI